jgi:hypothetical protein
VGTATAVVPPRLVAGVVRAVTQAVAGTGLIQGGVNAMVPMKWKAIMAAVLLAVAGTTGAGLLSAGAQSDTTADAAREAAPREAPKKGGRGGDMEEQIYRALREQGRWDGGGGYTLFAQRVEGRNLLNVALVNRGFLLLEKNRQPAPWREGLNPKKMGADTSTEPFIARARKATLQVDVARGHVLVIMHQALVQAADGEGFVESQVVPVPLPGSAARPSPTGETRKVVEEKYRQYELHVQAVRVDPQGRDLGVHGKGLVLAEPQLLTREDQEAVFHSGGEVAAPSGEPGTLELLRIGLRVRARVRRGQDGKLRLAAALETAAVEHPGPTGWRLRKTSVECLEPVKLGGEIKLVEKDSVGRTLYWVLIRVIREVSVESRTESREPAPAHDKRADKAADIIPAAELLGSIRKPSKAEQPAVVTNLCYLITDVDGRGERVYRLPLKGNETVLDAVAQLEELPALGSRCRMWIARLGSIAGAQPEVLSVDWKAISQQGQASTNYRLLPGDRLYIKAAEK